MTSSRIEVTETPFDVRVLIRSRRNVFLWLLLSVWLGFWTFGGVAAIVSIATSQTDRLFISLWLCGWAVGEAVATSAWLWNAFGVEQVLFNRDSFLHARLLFGRRLTRRTFPASEVFSFRGNGPFGTQTLAREQLLFTSGTIDVDCAYDSFSFGYQLEQNDAQGLADLLNSFVTRRTQRLSPRAKRA